jgi:hypothetical protein
MNASQMEELFGDSSDDSYHKISSPVTRKTPSCFGPIYEATRTFVAQHQEVIAALLTNDAIPSHLSSALSKATSLFLDQRAVSTMESVSTLSTKCADAAWTLLHENKAWPDVGWRELFTVASLMKICALLASSKFIQALQCADRSFMLGAPKHVTNLVFRLVDPLVGTDQSHPEQVRSK